MKTVVLKADRECPDPVSIQRAGDAIRRGELVGFPTETVYGLAADAFNETSVRRVFDVKGRPANNPLPVQVPSIQDVYSLVIQVPDVALRLMERFFPGPLTLVFKAGPQVSELITAGTGKVGIRMPDHPVAMAMLKAAETPIVAPSANPSGEPAPTNADQVRAYFDGKIEMILDAGETELGIASTVVDVTGDEMRILRLGCITAETLAEFGRVGQ